MAIEEKSSGSTWTWEQDKAFEMALDILTDHSSDQWEKIAAAVPGRTVEDVKHHYELLLADISNIELGHVDTPYYVSSSEGLEDHATNGGNKKGGSSAHQNGESHNGGRSSKSDQERRRGIAWTEDEHRLFLLGLDKYGKGDWRSISRNFVVTRTPTQVASHAQKYFNRMNSMNKDRRRTSIHDITTVDDGNLPAVQGPITGLTNAPSPTSLKSVKLQSQPSCGPAAVSVYGTPTIGQPIGGPFVSAIGTPVSIPTTSHMAYGVQPPLAGTIVPGSPVNVTPTTYHMSHASAQR